MQKVACPDQGLKDPIRKFSFIRSVLDLWERKVSVCFFSELISHDTALSKVLTIPNTISNVLPSFTEEIFLHRLVNSQENSSGYTYHNLVRWSVDWSVGPSHFQISTVSVSLDCHRAHYLTSFIPSLTWTKPSQELRMLSSVTINCQVTKIVMNSGSQLSEL